MDATVTGTIVRLEPHQWRGTYPLVVDVRYAALMFGDYVELAGVELGGDGAPVGPAWLLVNVHVLAGALVKP